MLKIGTYNIKNSGPLFDDPLDSWDHRKKAVKKIITDQNWDIFGLQEVKEEQLLDLQELTSYYHVGQIRDDSNEGEYNPIFYRKDRLTCQDQGTFWLSDTPEKMSHAHAWKAACPRIATWAKLTHKDTQENYLFIATHLDHVSELARTNGAKLILDFIKQSGEANVMLVGDFNGGPSENFYALLTEQLQDVLTCSQSHIGPRVTCTGIDFCQDPDFSKMIAIDFIFTSKNGEVANTEVVTERIETRFPSDHFPVSASLEFSSFERSPKYILP